MNTPYYKFDLEKIQNNFNKLFISIKPDCLFYALKANSETKILQSLISCNSHFEIASIGEYEKLNRLGVDSKNIICSSPIKTEYTIEQLYKAGIRYFVFDDLNEYKKIERLAPLSKKILRIEITHISADTIAYGMSKAELLQNIGFGNLCVDRINGITFYLSKNKQISVITKVLDYCNEIFEIIGYDEKILNIGGNYRLPEEIEEGYYNALSLRLSMLRKNHNIKVLAEPGRSIVKSAGSLLTTVIDVKKEKNQVFIDAGVPTGISYCPNCIVNLSNNSCCEEQEYHFFDITCSHRELFSAKISFDIFVNDILQFDNFGSYSICKSSQFHGWELPRCIFEED